MATDETELEVEHSDAFNCGATRSPQVTPVDQGDRIDAATSLEVHVAVEASKLDALVASTGSTCLPRDPSSNPVAPPPAQHAVGETGDLVVLLAASHVADAFVRETVDEAAQVVAAVQELALAVATTSQAAQAPSSRVHTGQPDGQHDNSAITTIPDRVLTAERLDLGVTALDPATGAVAATHPDTATPTASADPTTAWRLRLWRPL